MKYFILKNKIYSEWNILRERQNKKLKKKKNKTIKKIQDKELI